MWGGIPCASVCCGSLGGAVCARVAGREAAHLHAPRQSGTSVNWWWFAVWRVVRVYGEERAGAQVLRQQRRALLRAWTLELGAAGAGGSSAEGEELSTAQRE